MAEHVDKFLRLSRTGMCRVLPGLFIGSERDANDVETLTAAGITHILSVHERVGNQGDLPCGFTRHRVPIADASDTDIISRIAECNDFIHQARLAHGSVLVHCLVGCSRSVSLVVAYLMTVTRVDYWTALDAVTAVRPMANPNAGFRMQLRRFEDKMLRAEQERICLESIKCGRKYKFEEDADLLRALVTKYKTNSNNYQSMLGAS